MSATSTRWLSKFFVLLFLGVCSAQCEPNLNPPGGPYFHAFASFATLCYTVLFMIVVQDHLPGHIPHSGVKKSVDYQLMLIAATQILVFVFDPQGNTCLIHPAFQAGFNNTTGSGIFGVLTCYSLMWFMLAKSLQDDSAQATNTNLTKKTAIGCAFGWISIFVLDFIFGARLVGWVDVDTAVTSVSICVYCLFVWSVLLAGVNIYIYWSVNKLAKTTGKDSKLQKGLNKFTKTGVLGPLFALIYGVRYLLLLNKVLVFETDAGVIANETSWVLLEVMICYYCFNLTRVAAKAQRNDKRGSTSRGGPSKGAQSKRSKKAVQSKTAGSKVEVAPKDGAEIPAEADDNLRETV